MKPGRELDALIAEKVMGLYKEPLSKRPGYGLLYSNRNPLTGECMAIGTLKFYSTDIAAAWEVVENFLSQGKDFTLDSGPNRDTGIVFHSVRINDVNYTYSASAPHAICLAALKAVEK